MEVGRHVVRVVDYGISRTKAGGVTVFAEIVKGSESMKWYGSPFKKDGELNDMCISQLVACGFDPENNEIKDLQKGVDSGLLITDEDLDCEVAMEMGPDGTDLLKVKWLGCSPVSRLSTEEAKELISDEKEKKLKASASKFKVRKRKPKENPGEAIPF